MEVLCEEFGDAVEAACYSNALLGMCRIAHHAMWARAVEVAGSVHATMRASAVLLLAFVSVCKMA